MLKRALSSVLMATAALLGAVGTTPAMAQKTSVPLLLCPAGCGPTEGDTRRKLRATCTTSAR
jgi:hypothetical protein